MTTEVEIARPRTGRPTDYTQELADRICDQLADGDSLRKVCLEDDMPGKSTVFRWLRLYPEFRDQYTRAKEESADALFDEILDIADDGSNDLMEKLDSDGAMIGWRENGEVLQRSRLRVDARKWMLSKIKPKKYGEKVTQEIGGIDGKPIDMEWRITVVGAKDESGK